MKNEIGRKLTSLTIMAIMFAGGMAIGVPSFMPVAAADFSVTQGELSVNTEYIQGAAVLEIVVNDPDISSTIDDINAGASVSIGGTSYDMSQGVNGKWYLYVVDQSMSKLADGHSNGMEYGYHCDTGLGIDGSSTIIPSGTDVWAAALTTSGETAAQAGSCLDINNMIGTLDSAASTSREDLTAVILTDAPTLSNHNEKAATDSDIDLGQRGHALNESGYGSWPYILSIELTDDNIIEYGSDSINVEFGNTDDSASINIINDSPASYAELHLTITDPALNIDPTGADLWLFDLGASAATPLVEFATNGTTNDPLTAAELAEIGFEDNGRLYSDNQAVLTAGESHVVMTESSENSALFESFDLNGESEIELIAEAGGDKKIVFTYGDESTDMIVTYYDATIEFADDGGDWMPTEVATFTITDPDANKNPLSQDELLIEDETAKIPTIIMGTGGLTLAEGSNCYLDTYGAASCGADNLDALATLGVNVGSGTGGSITGVTAYNTTDNSERLRIVHNGTETGNGNTGTVTWVNVTTGHTRADLVGLAGTVVLSYNVDGPAGLVSSSAVSVFITDSGDNTSGSTGSTGTTETTGVIGVQTTGNVRSGVVDLDDDTEFLRNSDVSAAQTWSGASVGTDFVTVAFKLTHAAGSDLATDADYAISADFCNFD